MSYLQGPLKLTIEHLGSNTEGSSYPFERSGPASIWGEGLEHITIEGLGDDASVPAPAAADPNAALKMVGIAAALGGVAFVLLRKQIRHNPRRRRRSR